MLLSSPVLLNANHRRDNDIIHLNFDSGVAITEDHAVRELREDWHYYRGPEYNNYTSAKQIRGLCCVQP